MFFVVLAGAVIRVKFDIELIMLRERSPSTLSVSVAGVCTRVHNLLENNADPSP